MPVVTFKKLNKTRSIKIGATILAAANQAGVPIGQSCSGDGICGWCRVQIIAGANNLAPPGYLEKSLWKGKCSGPMNGPPASPSCGAT
jgi:ferredoxin